MYKKDKIFFCKEKKTKKQTDFNWRLFTLYSFIFLSFFILTVRVMFLQAINSDKLIREGDRRTLRTQSLLNTRGIINDRQGYPLAVTISVNAICADPSEITNTSNIDNNERWKDLSNILSISLNKIFAHINNHRKSRFVYLARQITPDIGEYVKKLHLPGIFVLEESKRYYPYGKIIAPLIGFTNIDGVGIEGTEKSFNTVLTGQTGKRKIRRDNKGRIVENTPLIKQGVSNNLTLSIDTKIQMIVYHQLHEAVKKHNANNGIAILTDIKTGEILAMANYPSYNPNNIKKIVNNNVRNRAITDVFEPGSTVKPIVMMEALRLGVIQEDSIINTTPFLIHKHLIKDISYHQQLSVTGILKKSSNVGISKIALSIPTINLINSYFTFGLGQPTQLGLTGEQNGSLPKKQHWSNLEKATFSFGYGLMVTPLQLTRAYATIGSGGIYRPLSILKVNHPVPGTRVFPQQYVKKVINMMESVSQSGGSGVKAAVKGYRVAIKTGTAKKIDKTGHYIKKYIAYTAGIAPVSHPMFSLVIVIDNPKGKQYYGGSVSAPVFSKIMTSIFKIMNIAPDNLSNKKLDIKGSK